MIGDEHEIPHAEIPVYPAGGVGQNQRPAVQRLEHPHRTDDGGHLVALIIMKPPLHTENVLPGQTSGHKLPGVPRRGGERKARDLGIGDHHRVPDALRQSAQPGAQHQRHLGLQRQTVFQKIRRLMDKFVFSVHGKTSCTGPAAGF